MSLRIDPNSVLRVLLPDGVWYPVEPGSFDLDSYEFVDREERYTLHGGGDAGICCTGFSFRTGPAVGANDEAGAVIAGPLTAILAVRHRTP